jgi:hypothetical protein
MTRPRRCPLLHHRRLARGANVSSEDALGQQRTPTIRPRRLSVQPAARADERPTISMVDRGRDRGKQSPPLDHETTTMPLKRRSPRTTAPRSRTAEAATWSDDPSSGKGAVSTATALAAPFTREHKRAAPAGPSESDSGRVFQRARGARPIGDRPGSASRQRRPSVRPRSRARLPPIAAARSGEVHPGPRRAELPRSDVPQHRRGVHSAGTRARPRIARVHARRCGVRAKPQTTAAMLSWG